MIALRTCARETAFVALRRVRVGVQGNSSVYYN